MKNSMQVGNIFFRSLIRETKRSDTTLQQKTTRRRSHPIPLSASADNTRGKALRELKIQIWLFVFTWTRGLNVGKFPLLPEIRHPELIAVFDFVHTWPAHTSDHTPGIDK
jgi:hypothetical protein